MAGNWFDGAGPRLLPPGTRVGAYTLGQPLGAGAMGAVYQAHDDGGAQVALKLIHQDFDADPAARELMAREVEALQRLRHPNVVRVLDAELDASEAFVVTELVPGKTLAAEIADGGPLDATDLYELAEQLSAALLALETAGVVHRDVKPSNIIIGQNGPVLIDFGIARSALAGTPAIPSVIPRQGADAAQIAESISAPTQFAPVEHGTRLMGTPGYLAPELLRGAPPTYETDWWSWAAVLAFAGTGRPPFGYGAPDEVFHRELQGRADLVGLPPRTAAALLGALSVDPAARTSPAQMIQALRRDAAAVEMPQRTSVYQREAVTPHQHPGATQVMPPGGQGFATQVLPPVNPGFATQVLPPVMPGATQVLPPVPPDATRVMAPVVAPTKIVMPTQMQFPPLPFGAPPPGLNVAPAGYMQPPSGNPTPAPGYATPAPEPFPVYQRPVLPKRTGVLAALALPLILGATRLPIIAFAIFAALAVLMRIVGTLVNDLHLRRELAGQARQFDAAVVAARSPLTLVRGIVGALPQLLVGLCSGLLIMALGWWATGARGWLPLLEPHTGLVLPWVHPAILALAMLVALLIAWFGTHSYLTRYGARVVLNTVTPGRFGVVLVVLGLLLAGYLLSTMLVAPSGDINWWPAVAPPLL